MKKDLGKYFIEHAAIKFLIDPENGKIVDANYSAAKYFGWSRDELINMSLAEINTLSESEIQKEIENSISSNKTHFEFKHKLKSGEIRDVEIYSSRIEIGDKYYLHSVIHDITDRKLIEKELNSSNERWENLFNNSPSAIAVYEAIDKGNDFIFTDYNLTAQKIDGLSREDVLSKRISEVFPTSKELGFIDVFRRVWETGKTEEMNIAFYNDQRTKGWRDNVVYKLKSGEVVAIYNDITEQCKIKRKFTKVINCC